MHSLSSLRPLSSALKRSFASSPAVAGNMLVNSKYNVVKFKKENLGDVMAEVPEMQYYIIGGQFEPNPYALVTMDQPLVEPPQAISAPKPEVKISQLENGLKIVSMDRGGTVANLGLFVNAGLRHEEPYELGVAHMVRMVAYKSTAHLSYLRTVKTFEFLGADAGCENGREHISYWCEIQRESVPVAIPLLVGNVLFPRLLPWEINDRHVEIDNDISAKSTNSDNVVADLLHQTAYHRNTLGNSIVMPDRARPYFTPDTIRNFMLKHFSPERSVFVGVNVDHADLTKWCMRTFVDYNAIPFKERSEDRPNYTGGITLRDRQLGGVSHIALGYETDGWNSADMIPAAVLQTLLGGVGSFSGGGPGRGMFSRLEQNIISKYPSVESCMCFNTMHSDTGLFGLYAAVPCHEVPQAVQLMSTEFKGLNSFSEEEVSRAKNSLKATVSLNVENGKTMVEDFGRQMMLSGKVQTPDQFCAAIDKVKTADLVALAAKMRKSKPTYVVYGDTVYAPNYEQLLASLA